MYPGQPRGVAPGGDSNRGKLLLANGNQGGTRRADAREPEQTFGICSSQDYLGLAGLCHPGSHHRGTSHTLDLSV